jgi:hypothetical protein
MHFSKDDLNGYYKWAVEDRSSLFTGMPTRRLFDRWNGNQVLFLINTILEQSSSSTIEDGKRVEDLLIHHLPVNINSEKSVFNWLLTELELKPQSSLSATDR